MSRTPVFRFLSRSLRQADRANRAGLSSAEIVESDRAMRAAERRARAQDAGLAAPRTLNRRRFVTSSSAALAGVLAAGCTRGRLPAGAAPGGDPVVIVGAGIAGLTAAYRLRQSGVPVRIFDAQNRVGGRMYSLRGFFPDGQVAELGGELIDTNHEAIRSLAEELDIALDDLSLEAPGLAEQLWYFGGQLRGDVEVVEAFRPIAARLAADRATMGDDVSYHDPAGATTLDSETLAQWLDRAGVSGWLRDLLTVGYTTEYGIEIEEQSALNLLFLIDPYADPFRMYGESDERFHARDGNDRIPLTLAERLADAIEPNSVLEAVRTSSDGRFVASFTRSGSSFEARAADLVLALPFTLLRRVRLDLDLPPVKRRAIDELGYGNSAKLMIGFSDRVWRRDHASAGSVLSDLPFQLVWETSRQQSGTTGILTNFTGGRHALELGAGSAEQQAADTARQLETVFPGVLATRPGAKAVRFHWPSFPWALGGYAGYLAGQWTSIAGAEGESVGRLRFAGEHCSSRAQGFMEGGCETGEAVAAEILVERGVRVSGAPVGRRGFLTGGTRQPNGLRCRTSRNGTSCGGAQVEGRGR